MNLATFLTGQNKKKENKLTRKSRGSTTGAIVTTALCLVMILSIFLIYIHFTKIIRIKESIDMVGREYMLLLETQGELTDEQVAHLEERVGEHFSTYDVTFNDDNTRRPFGEEVTIKIHATATWEELGITRVMDIIQDEYEFTTEYVSLSKAKDGWK